jgi:hypothetical protein
MPFSTSVSPAEVAAASLALLHEPLVGAAHMQIARIDRGACFFGQFDRAPTPAALPTYRRGTGGVTFVTEEDALYIGIALEHPAALVAASANQVLNRMVRPLLKALTRCTGKRTAYFGRDHVSAERANVGWVAMGHVVATGRATFEGFLPPIANVSASELAAEVARAYAAAHPALAIAAMTPGGTAAAPMTVDEPTWSATEDEAIGTIGILRDHHGRRRLGGTLMASEDRMHALNEAIQAPMQAQECAEFLDSLFAPPAMLFGVRSLESILRLVRSA